MVVTPIKTEKITPGSINLNGLLDKYLAEMKEGTVLAATSKIISLCEGQVKPGDTADVEQLWKKEAEYFLPAEHSRYGHHFSITGHTLVGRSGIDQSNGGGFLVLWPSNPQTSANQIRQYLRQKFKLNKLGVIITDSISIPMRLGAVGSAIAYSGFKPLKDYVGTPDLFGRNFEVERANLAEGLAGTAVLAMGEGAEQTPLAVISDLPNIEFCANDPSAEELANYHLNMGTDLFEVFYKSTPWQKGYRGD